MSSNLATTIARAIRRMSTEQLRELLAEVSTEFGITIAVPEAAKALPLGWVAVPVEMTPAMVRVAGTYSWTTVTLETNVRRMWSHILSVRPPDPGER